MINEEEKAGVHGDPPPPPPSSSHLPPTHPLPSTTRCTHGGFIGRSSSPSENGGDGTGGNVEILGELVAAAVVAVVLKLGQQQ